MSVKITFGTKLGLTLARSHASTSLRHTSAVVARGGCVAACSTAFGSATEENDSGGLVDGTCPTKVAQPNSTADWLKILVTSPD